MKTNHQYSIEKYDKEMIIDGGFLVDIVPVIQLLKFKR